MACITMAVLEEDSVAEVMECLLSEAVGGSPLKVSEGLMVEGVEGLHGALS